MSASEAPATALVPAEAWSSDDPSGLEDVIQTVSDYHSVKDTQQYEIVVGAAAAHFLPGEMLWLRVIGASRSGKTSFLETLLGHPSVQTLGSLTPASIRGGLEGGHRLLDRINGKLVVMPEMAVVNTLRYEQRREVVGLLRAVKDGLLVSDFGTEEGYIEQQSRFDLICATTAVDHRDNLLGARFVDLRWVSGDRAESARMAAEFNPWWQDIETQLRGKVHAQLNAAEEKARTAAVQVDGRRDQIIARMADFAAWARTPVARGGNHEVIDRPLPELGTDIAQSFTKLYEGLRLVGVADPFPHIARLARDSIPPFAVDIMEVLLVTPGCGTRELARRANIPFSTISRHLEVELLGLLVREEGWNDPTGARAQWNLTADCHEHLRFLRDVE